VRGEVSVRHLGECLHIDGQAGKLLIARVTRLGWGRLRDFIGRHDRGPNPYGAVKDRAPLRILRHRCIDRNPMANRELDLVAVEHRHQLLVEIELLVGKCAPLKDWRTIRRLDDKLWLEDPGAIFANLGLLLAVDQEQGDNPLGRAFAHDALNHDIRPLGIGRPGCDLAVQEWDGG